MSAVLSFVSRHFRHNRLSFCLGIAAALVPAISGLLLLGVAGWFITAAGIAGATGVFLNIFAPSAMIRALAILRTAGRYGERMLTHDATFRYLADLRTKLFAAMASKSLSGQRSGLLLNRLTIDISALDGVYLRLVVPSAVISTVSLAALAIWLSMPAIVFAAGAVCLSGWFGLAVYAVRSADKKLAHRADAANEAMRLRATDMVAGRRDLQNQCRPARRRDCPNKPSGASPFYGARRVGSSARDEAHNPEPDPNARNASEWNHRRGYAHRDGWRRR